MKENKNLMPDFLGIGGARCGSTWLHSNLREHPSMWLPHRKELHYFDRSLNYPSPSHLSDGDPLRRLFGSKKHNKKFRVQLIKEITKCIIYFKPHRLPWNIRYFFGRYSDDWYATLFAPGKDKIKGEITPAYSILDSQDVYHIYKIMPQAKIIFLLRNPIQRTWSSIRKNRKSSLSIDKIKEFLEDPATVLRNDYLRTISVWRSYFPNSQLFIGFFDDIIANPGELLFRIYEFLGVPAISEYITPLAHTKIFSSPNKDLPHELEVIFARKYISNIRDLCEVVGSYTKTWLADAEAVLRHAEPGKKESLIPLPHTISHKGSRQNRDSQR